MCVGRYITVIRRHSGIRVLYWETVLIIIIQKLFGDELSIDRLGLKIICRNGCSVVYCFLIL